MLFFHMETAVSLSALERVAPRRVLERRTIRDLARAALQHVRAATLRAPSTRAGI